MKELVLAGQKQEKPEFAKGGKHTETISATAGNVTVSISPGAGKRYKLEYLFLTLVADATATNRYFRMQVHNNAGTKLADYGYNTNPVTASQTKYFTAEPITLEELMSWGSTFVVGVDNLFIEGTDKLYLDISGGQAGDSWEGIVILREEKV